MTPLTRLKMLGLALLTTLMAMAFVGASSAIAESTALCSSDEITCASPKTHIHEESIGHALLLSSFATVECEALFLGDTLNSGSGKPLIIHGTYTYTCLNGCTATEENGPAEIKVLKEGAEFAAITLEGLVHFVCGLNCRYNGYGLEGEALGALAAGNGVGEAWLEETVVNKESGTFCPSTSKLDIATEPLSATYLGGSGFTPSTIYGSKNISSPNIHLCFQAKPVNCATGNQTESQTDLLVGGRPGLKLVRTYNSQLAATQNTAGTFGYGWTASYGSWLEIGKETATVHQDDGSTAVFNLKEGKYTAPSWVQSSLTKEGENYIFIPPDQTKQEYNSSGKLTKVTERHGLAITLTYNGKGQLESVADPASRKLVFTYNAGGQVESIKDPMGHVAKYTYESGSLATVVLPGEAKANWKFGYNTFHEMTSMTDGRGYTTTTSYDASHRVTAQTVPPERKYKWEYGESGGIKETTITEPSGSVTVETFNLFGEPLSVTHAAGTELESTTTHTYDSLYNLTSTTDPNNQTTEYAYDWEGNRTSETDPNGNKTKWTYDSTHDVESITNPKGQTTEFGRNAAGDVEWIFREGTGPTYQETTLEYNKYGDLTSRTDPLGRTTTYTYDAIPLFSHPGAGVLIFETNPEGDKSSFAYNSNSQRTLEVSPRGNEKGAEESKFTTTTTYDERGRKTAVTDSLGNVIEYGYDANGNLTAVTDANGNTTAYLYNAANERTDVITPMGSTGTTYDSMGQVTSKIDGNANVTKYIRNELEQIVEEIDPLERKTTHEYDAAGNLKKTTDPEGRTTTYSYDAGNRLIKIDYSEEATPDVTLEYDKDGNVVTMKDGTGTTKKTYDSFDRLIEVENGNKEVVKYEYNLAEEITKLTYPNGKSITRAFDKAGRLEKITDWIGGETKFAYNRDSALTSTTFPSGSSNKDEYEYNNVDQLTKTTMKKGAETLASLSYARDKLGQIETTTQTGLPGEEKVVYGYDENNRLTKGAGSSFEYDEANNATKLGAEALTYNKASQLEKGGAITYAFNKIGQRTKATPETGPATTYSYDQAGNLISVQRAAEGEITKINQTYKYDGTGLRASESDNGNTYPMAWDVAAELPLLLSDSLASYVYGPEGLPIEQINSKGEPLYLHHDQQGSTRLLTGSTGKVEGAYAYSPYGVLTEHTGTAVTQLGYGGQYRSHTTRLIYLRARVYDPVTAQFFSVDPMVAESGESYSYTADNPINQSDPSGLLVNGWCGQSSFSVPFGQVEVSICRLVDGNGNVGWTSTLGGNVGQNWDGVANLEKYFVGKALATLNESWSASLVYFSSDANSIDDLLGWSDTFTFSAGYLATFNYGTATSSKGIHSKTVGGGFGFGFMVGAGRAFTNRIPDQWIPRNPFRREESDVTFYEVDCEPTEYEF